MSSTVKKTPPANAGVAARRGSTDLTGATTSRTPPRSTSPSVNGVARTRSLRNGGPVSARGSLQRGVGSNLSVSSLPSSSHDDAHAETVSVIEELKERLKQTEISSEQFEKQAQVLQARLDETHQEQGKLEDRLHESEERIEGLENEKREMSRQKREMEAIYEAERSAMTREKDEMANREEEMQAVIQRLKDNISQRNANDEHRMSRQLSNNTMLDDGQFAPSSAIQRSDSRNNSKLLLQKDRVIEQLRLELAEAQIKVVETENAGGGRLQEVERQLMEARMTNARLMEDNESFQLLLREKTLNGDFTKDFGYSHGSANSDALEALEGRKPAPSLADELSELGEDDANVDADKYRRLETELRASKDQNKALTLYINKIIERLLQHSDFENILDQSSEYKPPSVVDKDLPPPPPPKDGVPSILQRAKSAVTGAGPARPPLPSPTTEASSAFNDPETAPSIPIGLSRSSSMRQGRPMSEQFARGGAATVVNQMYKPPTGQSSPPLYAPQTRGQSWFAPPAPGGNPNAGARVPSGQTPSTTTMGSSGSFPGGAKSDTSSLSDAGDVSTPPSMSPPRVEKQTTFAGNKPRPLRLVQGANMDAARRSSEEDKRSKRASWMGWASWGREEVVPDASIKE